MAARTRKRDNASCNDTIAFPMVASLVDQFDEAIPFIREIDVLMSKQLNFLSPTTRG
jgi:hypothetical protein